MPGHADLERIRLAFLGPLVVPQVGIVINAPHRSVSGCAAIMTNSAGAVNGELDQRSFGITDPRGHCRQALGTSHDRKSPPANNHGRVAITEEISTT
jgi:hypothetical protein